MCHVKIYCAVINHALTFFWLQFKYQFNSIKRKCYSVQQRFIYQCTKLQYHQTSYRQHMLNYFMIVKVIFALHFVVYFLNKQN
jgi:hypothetical protein